MYLISDGCEKGCYRGGMLILHTLVDWCNTMGVFVELIYENDEILNENYFEN